MEKPKLSPKDFFLHLGVMVALYVSAVNLLTLLFQTIDYAYPSALAYSGDPYSSGIQIAIATLVVFFPVYLFLAWLLARGEKISPEKRELGVRKWLIYFTLFVAGITVAIDLVTLIQYFLSGEITIRFILKVVSVLLVAGVVFGYYVYDLRRKDVLQPGAGKIFASGAIVIVLISLVFGFYIMGAPWTAREKRLDAQRVSDLQNIQWQVVNFWQQKGSIPTQLSDMEDSISGWRTPNDPVTNLPYTYENSGIGENFSLCADFSRSNIGEADALRGRGGSYATPYSYYPSYNTVSMSATQKAGDSISTGSWEHEMGNYCFERTIDPDLYPVRPIPVK